MLSALFELLGSFFGLAIKFGFIAIAAVVIHVAVAGYLDTTFGIELPTTFINEGFESFVNFLLETLDDAKDMID